MTCRISQAILFYLRSLSFTSRVSPSFSLPWPSVAAWSEAVLLHRQSHDCCLSPQRTFKSIVVPGHKAGEVAACTNRVSGLGPKLVLGLGYRCRSKLLHQRPKQPQQPPQPSPLRPLKVLPFYHFPKWDPFISDDTTSARPTVLLQLLASSYESFRRLRNARKTRIVNEAPMGKE